MGILRFAERIEPAEISGPANSFEFVEKMVVTRQGNHPEVQIADFELAEREEIVGAMAVQPG